MKTFKLILKSLINNDACVEGGRKHKSIIAIIMALIAVIIGVLPVMISGVKINGDQFVASNSYNIETGLVRFVENLNEENKDLIVKVENNNHYLDLTPFNVSGPARIYEHKDAEDKIDFVVYAINNTDVNDFDQFRNLVVAGVTDPIDQTKDIEEKYKNVNVIIFGKTNFFAGICPKVENPSYSGVIGDYQSSKEGFNFKDLIKVTKDDATIDPKTTDPILAKEYKDGVFKNWKAFFCDCYLRNKTISVWSQIGIFSAINVGLVVIMGLVIFLITRGKRNVFNFYTFWECQKIVYWASIAPAVLGFLIGLLFTAFAPMGFILMLGLRTMWMSLNTFKNVQ